MDNISSMLMKYYIDSMITLKAETYEWTNRNHNRELGEHTLWPCNVAVTFDNNIIMLYTTRVVKRFKQAVRTS